LRLANRSRRFIEFFTANIRNRARAWPTREVKQFFDSCEKRKLELKDIEPLSVAAYIEQLGTEASKPTVKQHLAAIRKLFDYLTTTGFWSPIQQVPYAGQSTSSGAARPPVLSAEEARKLLDSIDIITLIGLRDRARIGTMVFSLARVGAAVTMRVGDFFQHRKRLWLRLREKGGKRHEVPCHPSLEGYLDAYIKAAGIAGDTKGRPFCSMHKGDKLTVKPMTRFHVHVLQMIKPRAKRPPSPIPPVVILFELPASPPTAARSSMPRPSRTINRPGRPSFMTEPERNCRWTRSKESRSEIGRVTSNFDTSAQGERGHCAEGELHKHRSQGRGIKSAMRPVADESAG
jgi:site-specific recombinase XerD